MPRLVLQEPCLASQRENQGLTHVRSNNYLVECSKGCLVAHGAERGPWFHASGPHDLAFHDFPKRGLQLWSLLFISVSIYLLQTQRLY